MMVKNSVVAPPNKSRSVLFLFCEGAGTTYDGVATPQLQSSTKCVRRCSFFYLQSIAPQIHICAGFSVPAPSTGSLLCAWSGSFAQSFACFPYPRKPWYSSVWHQHCAHAYITLPVLFSTCTISDDYDIETTFRGFCTETAISATTSVAPESLFLEAIHISL